MNISEVQSSTRYFTQFRRFLSPLVPSISWVRVKDAFSSLGGCFKSKPTALQERRVTDISDDPELHEQPQRSFLLKCFAGLAAGAVLGSGVYAIARRLPSEELQQDPFLPATQGGVAPQHRFGSTLPWTTLPDLVLTEEVPYIEGQTWYVQDVFGPAFEPHAMAIGSIIGYNLPKGLTLNMKPMQIVSSVPVLGGGHTLAIVKDFGIPIMSVNGYGDYGSIIGETIDISDPKEPKIIGSEISNCEREVLVYAADTQGVLQIQPRLQIIQRDATERLLSLAGYTSSLLLPDTTSFDSGGAICSDYCFGWGKSCYSYCYVTTNSSLLVIDVNIHQSTHEASSYIIGSLPLLKGGNIAIINNSSIALTDDNAIKFINVTNPSIPTRISQVIFPDTIMNIATEGNYCYVVTTNYIDVIDISNIAHPKRLHFDNYLSSELPGLRGIAVKNNLCYVTGNLALHVFSYDFLNSVSSGYTIYTGVNSLHSNNIVLVGDYCYFTDGNGVKVATKGNSFNLAGMPAGGTQGNYTITLTAYKYYPPKEKSIKFNLFVKPAITISKMIPMQFARIGKSFTYAIGPNTFKHVNGKPLKYISGPLPTWLRLSEGVFSSVLPPSTKETVPITVNATDNQGATASTKFQVKVLFGPSVKGIKPIGDQIAKANIPFKVTFANAFQDQDQGSPDFTGMDYSATNGGEPLPKWLTLNSNQMIFSGTPSVQEVGSIMQIDLTARAFPYNLTATTNFQITVVMPASPELRTPLDNKEAPMGQLFKYAVPLDTFIDPFGGPISYSAQYSAKWLSFANNTFTGTPGHGDTDPLSNRVDVITVIAKSQTLSSKTTFNITITGDSWFTLIVFKIISPIVSGLGTALGLYKKRAMILNRWNKEKYLKADSHVQVGQSFSRTFSVPRESIRHVRALYNGKNLAGEEGNELPQEFTYNRISNSLQSVQVPEPKGLKYITIQVLGDADVILEQFNVRFPSAEGGVADHSGDVELSFKAPREGREGDYVLMLPAED